MKRVPDECQFVSDVHADDIVDALHEEFPLAKITNKPGEYDGWRDIQISDRYAREARAFVRGFVLGKSRPRP